MKELMILEAIITLVICLGIKQNIICIRVCINIGELHKNIPDILRWATKLLLAALVGSLLK